MANKLGFYLHSFEIGEHKPDLFRAIQEIQPPTMLVHAWDQIDQLRRLAPNSFIIGRMTYFGRDKIPLEKLVGNWLDDAHPEDRGRDFADHILHDNFDAALKKEGPRLLIDAWMSLNEVVPGPESSAFKEKPQEIGRRLHAYDAFQVGFRNKLQEKGIEAVAFNFGAGNFRNAQQYLQFMPETLKSYTYLGFHEYGWPALSKAVDPAAVSSAGTYRGIVAALRQAKGRDYQAILTEAGLTFMFKFADSGFDQGWLFDPPAKYNSPRLTQDQYWRSLDWLNTTLEQDAWAKGACLFEVGHAGRWENFRHFGKDAAGQPVTIMQRIKALAQAAPKDLGLEPAGPTRDFVGVVVDQDGVPVAGAALRLVAGLATLGGDPRAVGNSRGAVTWTRALTGFRGSLWNCWQKYVAAEVAAIAWEEFRREAAQYNPSLRDSDDLMRPDERYFLPENRPPRAGETPTTDIVWDRLVTGFDGDLWGCWRENLQGKVVGLTWDAFRRDVLLHNPGLKPGVAPGGEGTIVLPRNGNQDEYARVAYTGDDGAFRFQALPAGSYRLETVAEGFLSDIRDVVAPATSKVLIGLQAPLVVVGKGADFVGVAGRDFVIGGRRFRFVGVNLRGLVHYGKQPGRPSADARTQLSAARGMGARVVRVFAPHREVSVDETVRRLRELLNMMHAEFPDMYLILALCNLYGDVDFRVPGDDGAYANSPILPPEWFRTGYKGPYTSFARTLVQAFRDEPQILGYNVGNELKAEQQPELLVSFMHTMAAQIREWDQGNHLITTGMISTRHAWMAGNDALRMRLYSSPNLDFITNHAYHDNSNDAPSPEDDSDLSQRLSKPLLIEEAGFVGSGDRTGWFEGDLRRLVDEKKAAGFMPWGFMVGHDNNDGDKALGLDHQWHGADWNSLNNVFRNRAGALANDNALIEPPKPQAKFSLGQKVWTQTTVNMRKEPGRAAARVQQLPARTEVEIMGDGRSRDGLLWWPVRVGNVDGFVAQKDKDTVLLAAA